MTEVYVDCLCPPDGTRHPDGDTVRLRERLDFHAATTIRNAMIVLNTQDAEASIAETLAVLTEHYLLFGIESWTLVDEHRKPIEVTKPTIRAHLLSRTDIAMTVGDAADELYQESVLLPLVARGQRFSQPTPTVDSTSRTNGSARGRPKPSRRSSTATTPTAATGTTSTSPAGASSSSLSLK